MKKLLTIGIPAYNIEQYLPQCLDSVLLPDVLDDVEVLVINDGSTDNTAQIAGEYEKKYPGTVRVITKENGGWGSGVNLAMQEASGEYFKNLDSDDWFSPEGFRVLLKNMRENPADLMVSTAVEYSMKDGKERPFQFPSSYISGRVVAFPEMCRTLNYLFRMPSLAFRTELIRKNRVELDRCFYSDLELISFPLVGAETIFIQKEPVYVYRVGRDGQSMSFTSMAKHMEDIRIVAERIAEWYIQLKKTEPDEDSLRFFRRITKTAFSSYINQPFTVTDPVLRARYVSEIRQFKKKYIDADPQLLTPEDYGIFSSLVLKSDFKCYSAIAAAWRFMMKNSAAASSAWRFLMNLKANNADA